MKGPITGASAAMKVPFLQGTSPTVVFTMGKYAVYPGFSTETPQTCLLGRRVDTTLGSLGEAAESESSLGYSGPVAISIQLVFPGGPMARAFLGGRAARQVSKVAALENILLVK